MDAVDPIEVDLGPGVRAGFSTRAGGVSVGRHAGLNVGTHVDDDATRAHTNRELLGRWLGAEVRFVDQVHGAQVLDADQYPPSTHHEADAIVCQTPGVGIGVMVADCVPVLLADADAGVVATAHAGRPGLVAGVVPNAVAAMTARGARPERIRAALGPSICGSCYEVPEQMREEVEAAVPGSAGRTRWGTPSVDIARGVRAQLSSLGVRSIDDVGVCTYEDDRFYSYRRDGVTGRFAGVVTLLPPPPDPL